MDSSAPYKLPRPRIDSCVGRALEVWKTQQARHICVIHQHLAAVAVNLVSPNRSRHWDQRVCAKSSLHLVARAVALFAISESWRITSAIVASCRSDVTAKRFEGTRNEKMHASSDGRKQECNEPVRFHRIPEAISSVSVGNVCISLKAIGTRSILRCCTRMVSRTAAHRMYPGRIEWRVSPVPFQYPCARRIG